MKYLCNKLRQNEPKIDSSYIIDSHHQPSKIEDSATKQSSTRLFSYIRPVTLFKDTICNDSYSNFNNSAILK